MSTCPLLDAVELEPDAAAPVPFPLFAAVVLVVVDPVVDDAVAPVGVPGATRLPVDVSARVNVAETACVSAPRRAVAVTTWVDAELLPVLPVATTAPMAPPTRTSAITTIAMTLRLVRLRIPFPSFVTPSGHSRRRS